MSRVIVGILIVIGFLVIGLTDTGLNDMLDRDKLFPPKNENTVNDNHSLFPNRDNDNNEESNQDAENMELEPSMKEYGLSRVVDGDTIIVIDPENGEEERVRLLLIDTPESVHPNGLIEAYGVEASDYAKEYFKGVRRVVLDIGEEERDKYDRLLAHVFVNGENFNLHMVEEGYARIAYVNEPNTKYLDEFKEAQQKAEKAKKNIWSIDGYVTDNGFDMSVVDEEYEEAS